MGDDTNQPDAGQPIKQILDISGNPIRSKSKERLFKMGSLVTIAGLLASFALLLSNWHNIRQGLGYYYPPRTTRVGVQMWGGFSLLPSADGEQAGPDEYGYPSTQNPYFSTPECFSVPSIEFSITNTNDIDMVINSMTIDVMPHPSPKFKIGFGPLVASADEMIYEANVRKGDRTTKCIFKEKDKFLKLAKGEAAHVRIYLRSALDGYISVRPNYSYTVGRTSTNGRCANYSPKVYFFHEIPPTVEEASRSLLHD